MSNEELALLAARGDKQALNRLWAQVERFVFSYMAKLANSPSGRVCMERAGLALDDLLQEGFLAVADAAKRYNPERGAGFLTLLGYLLKLYFVKAIGMRTQRNRRDPLLSADRMERPLGDDGEGACLADVIPDPTDRIQAAEKRIFDRQLHDALENCLHTLPEEFSDTLRRRYYQRQTLEQIADFYGISTETARQHTRRALLQMRRKHRFLRSFYDEVIGQSYHSTSLTAWQHGGSSVERTVEYLEKKGLLCLPVPPAYA